MTEEALKITSAIKTPREKNPGRVAAGKRLAAISKEAKERKKLERESCERSDTRCDNTSVVLAVGGLVVIGAAALYFLKSHCVFHNTEGAEETEKSKETEGTEGTEGREETAGSKRSERSEGTERSERPERPKRSFQAYSMDD